MFVDICVFKAKEGDAKHSAIVLDCFMEKWAYPDVRDELLRQYQNKFGADDRAVDGVIVEDKSSGSAMIPELRRAGLNVISFNPDDLTRSHALIWLRPLCVMGVCGCRSRAIQSSRVTR